MLDLGETEEQVAAKTGLSRSTIRRRLELAKLDQDIVTKKMSEEQKEGFYQLSLTDLYRLEKVKDEKDRNRILSQAKGPENLKFLIDQHQEELKRKETAKRIREAMKKAGIPKATKKQEQNRYSSGYASIEYYPFANTGKRIKIPEHSDKAFYVEDNWSIGLYDIAKMKPKTDWEKQQSEKSKKEKALKKVEKAMAAKRREFIRNIKDGQYQLRGMEKDLWFRILEETNVWVSAYEIATYLYQEAGGTQISNTWARAMMKEIPVEVQLLAILGKSYESKYLFNYDLSYNETNADSLKQFYKTLAGYGFSITDETEKAVLYGTHELYKDPKKGGDNEVLETDPEAGEAEGPAVPPVDDSQEDKETDAPVETGSGNEGSGEAGGEAVQDTAEGGRSDKEGGKLLNPLISQIRADVKELSDFALDQDWRGAKAKADHVNNLLDRCVKGYEPEEFVPETEKGPLKMQINTLTDTLRRFMNVGAMTAGRSTAYKLRKSLQAMIDLEEQ